MSGKPGPEEKICSTFLSMMEEKPFYKIKVTELCERSGINRNIFYANFDSIYAVIEHIEEDFLEGLEAERSYSYDRFKGRQLLDKTLSGPLFTTRYFDKNRDVYRLLMGANGDMAFQAKMLNYTRKSVQQILNSADFPRMTAAKEEIITEYVSNGLLSLTKWRVSQGRDCISMEEYSSIVQILINRCLEF